jgi:hypothetical protein
VGHDGLRCLLGSNESRLRGSSFASRVRGAIVGGELFVELALGVCSPFI